MFGFVKASTIKTTSKGVLTAMGTDRKNRLLSTTNEKKKRKKQNNPFPSVNNTKKISLSKQQFGGFTKASMINDSSRKAKLYKADSFKSNDEKYTTATKFNGNRLSQTSRTTSKKKKKKKKPKNQITKFFSKASPSSQPQRKIRSKTFVLHTCIVGIGIRETLTEFPVSVELVREPRNKYDKYALMVISKHRHIGYIPKQDAIVLSPALDLYAAKIDSIVTCPNAESMDLDNIKRIPLILTISELDSKDQFVQALRFHASVSRKKRERALKKKEKIERDRKFTQHSIMSLELKRRRHNNHGMMKNTMSNIFKQIPSAIWRFVFSNGGFNIRDFARVKIAWRVWNDVLNSDKEYLKHYFQFHRSLSLNTSMKESNTKNGLMRIVRREGTKCPILFFSLLSFSSLSSLLSLFSLPSQQHKLNRLGKQSNHRYSTSTKLSLTQS